MVIVEANTWASVFDQKNTAHAGFAPVRKYVLSTKRSLAWGGSTYLAELKKAESYLKLYSELAKAGFAVRFCDVKVDEQEIVVSALVDDKDFDDPHIIALQIVSKVPVIVTADKRSCRFIKLKRLYPKNHPRPKIYSAARNKGLLAHF